MSQHNDGSSLEAGSKTRSKNEKELKIPTVLLCMNSVVATNSALASRTLK